MTDIEYTRRIKKQYSCEERIEKLVEKCAELSEFAQGNVESLSQTGNIPNSVKSIRDKFLERCAEVLASVDTLVEQERDERKRLADLKSAKLVQFGCNWGEIKEPVVEPPDDPEDPEDPTDPTDPDNPENPDDPDNPENPENPDDKQDPSDPTNPEQTETPEHKDDQTETEGDEP